MDFFEPGAADPLRKSSVRPLLRVTCSARMHHPSPAPVLAEVWQTSHGPLFVASLPGGPGKVGDSPEGTSDRPAAARNDARRQRRSTGRADWTHIPITVVRVLLTDDVPVGLWVKCPDHEPVQLIRAQLSVQYERHRAAARADTLAPLYLGLDSVAALSSD